jgi:hypothetical protein
MRAAVLLRHSSHYRRDSFGAGLQRLGYRVAYRAESEPGPDDILILWNRMRAMEAYVDRYRAAGAAVIIAENGYLPRTEKQFALALDAHNGAGVWPRLESTRFEVEMQPWRRDGRHLLVLLQRGIGQQGIAMPTQWPADIAKRLGTLSDRPIVMRRHPGRNDLALEPSLRDCWAVVIWASGGGCKSIVAGVPVFHAFPKWIGASAARPLGADIEEPFVADRGEFMRSISWAQWGVSEIESGEAFEAVLSCRA